LQKIDQRGLSGRKDCERSEEVGKILQSQRAKMFKNEQQMESKKLQLIEQVKNQLKIK